MQKMEREVIRMIVGNIIFYMEKECFEQVDHFLIHTRYGCDQNDLQEYLSEILLDILKKGKDIIENKDIPVVMDKLNHYNPKKLFLNLHNQFFKIPEHPKFV